ncbi:MAG: helix-turn-helix transcriptional regulator, partial [Haliea sp.]
KEFAKSVGVLPSTYSNWLHGQHGLSLDGARRIKQSYNVTLDFLFFGEEGNLPEQIRNAWQYRPRP